MRSLDEEIARQLAEAARSGELEKAESYGKPLAEAEGWSDTPEALRMPFKILKDAGVVPREVEMFRERAALARALENCADDDGAPPARAEARRARAGDRTAPRSAAHQPVVVALPARLRRRRRVEFLQVKSSPPVGAGRCSCSSAVTHPFDRYGFSRSGSRNHGVALCCQEFNLAVA